MSALAITGARIFDGRRFLDRHAVVVEGTTIRAVLSEDTLPGGAEPRRVSGLLAPGFIDIQVNGGGGVLFNDHPTIEGIRAIGAAHRRFGTTGFLPTLITDSRDRMASAVGAVREAMAAGVSGVLGVHLEGPFLNPERKGVHDPRFMRPVEEEDIRLMTSPQSGVTLVTLAPEMVEPEVISRLSDGGVLVSAGHTAARYEVLVEAEARGLSGYTHLFNAMPPLAGRDPGPVGAALSGDRTFVSLIVDGHHVASASLRVAIAAKPPDRMILVTDAMSSVGSDLESFELQGRRIFRSGGRLTTAEGTLAGSDLDMASAVRNSVRDLGLPLEQALRMASANAAAFLGLSDVMGEIAPGRRANFVLLDSDLAVQGTWIDGCEEVVQ